MPFSAAWLVGRKGQQKSALGCPDRALQELPAWKLVLMRADGWHQLSVKLLAVGRGDDDSAFGETIQPA